MIVTVAICTWNRARLLDQTLRRLCELRIPPGVDWELLVIDNNCTDETPSVVAKYVDKLPVQHIVEPLQGQSHARNRAMKLAKGEILIWTDDDVLVEPGWMEAYIQAAGSWPDAAFFGGLIIPRFEHEPPDWMRENVRLLEGVLVSRDLGPVERVLQPGEWPWGANMAFRRTAFEGRLFDPNLGLRGDEPIRCDETEYCKSLERDGLHGVWVPSAVVHHYVPSGRMRLQYVRSHFEGSGRANVRIAGAAPGTIVAGAPVWLYRLYFKARARAVLHRVRRDPRWLHTYLSAAHLLGEIRENRAERRRHLPARAEVHRPTR